MTTNPLAKECCDIAIHILNKILALHDDISRANTTTHSENIRILIRCFFDLIDNMRFNEKENFEYSFQEFYQKELSDVEQNLCSIYETHTLTIKAPN